MLFTGTITGEDIVSIDIEQLFLYFETLKKFSGKRIFIEINLEERLSNATKIEKYYYETVLPTIENFLQKENDFVYKSDDLDMYFKTKYRMKDFLDPKTKEVVRIPSSKKRMRQEEWIEFLTHICVFCFDMFGEMPPNIEYFGVKFRSN